MPLDGLLVQLLFTSFLMNLMTLNENKSAIRCQGPEERTEIQSQSQSGQFKKVERIGVYRCLYMNELSSG
jgi:hypothetical protein